MTLLPVKNSSMLGLYSFFFFNDAATTELYTLSLHDALPIFRAARPLRASDDAGLRSAWTAPSEDRKSTRLNSSHLVISYAVFCLKKTTAVPVVGRVDLAMQVFEPPAGELGEHGVGVSGFHQASSFYSGVRSSSTPVSFLTNACTTESSTLALHDALPI